MDTSQIEKGLQRLFDQEQQRIVFWYDAEGEFEDMQSSLEIAGVFHLRLDQIGALEVKIRLEQEDPAGRYLLYTPNPEPSLEEDWLLDIRLYSRCFYADRVSIWCDELGLKHQALRRYLSSRKAFLKSQHRVNSLKQLIDANDQEDQLDLKILTVLTRSEKVEINAILIKILSGFCDQESDSFAKMPDAWNEIEKFALDKVFWKLIEQQFGYSEEFPALKNLLIRLLVSDFVYHYETREKSASFSSASPLKAAPDPLVSLRSLMLPEGNPSNNAVICLSEWRDRLNYFNSYENLSGLIAKELRMNEILQAIDGDLLLKVMTFEIVEQRIISSLRDQLIEEESVSAKNIKASIAQRRDGHWANPALANQEDSLQNRYSHIYDALASATDLFSLRQKYQNGFSYTTAEEMYQAYTDEIFRFDQHYRLFNDPENTAILQDDDLKSLKHAVEDCYSNWYITHLALEWGKFISAEHKNPLKDASLLKSWKLTGVKNQQNFFEDNVESILKKAPNTKVYVIISDAFRYEAAEELTKVLNLKKRTHADLKSQLGVLPSYTALGMAALLPHKNLSYLAKSSAEVAVNGISTNSLKQRAKILADEEGLVVKATELMDLKTQGGRDFVKGARVIYVYHDEIDAIGDKQATEDKTFQAVKNTIKTLTELVNYIVNTLNGTNIFITADHGFIYQESFLDPQDKSKLDEKPTGTLEAKKRYLLGIDLPEHPLAWHGNTKKTAGADGGMEFWIPKGANRFHFVGGSRFVHGGAMLQEIVVPVITIKALRGKEIEKNASKKVGISLLGTHHKVVTNQHRLEFVQTEAVSNTVLARTLLIGLWDRDQLISDEKTVTFSSKSTSMDDRKESVKLLLKSGQYQKNRDYHFIMRDAETKVEYHRVSVVIAIAFARDF